MWAFVADEFNIPTPTPHAYRLPSRADSLAKNAQYRLGTSLILEANKGATYDQLMPGWHRTPTTQHTARSSSPSKQVAGKFPRNRSQQKPTCVRRMTRRGTPPSHSHPQLAGKVAGKVAGDPPESCCRCRKILANTRHHPVREVAGARRWWEGSPRQPAHSPSQAPLPPYNRLKKKNPCDSSRHWKVEETPLVVLVVFVIRFEWNFARRLIITSQIDLCYQK